MEYKELKVGIPRITSFDSRHLWDLYPDPKHIYFISDGFISKYVFLGLQS